jgi:hypothetical protein
MPKMEVSLALIKLIWENCRQNVAFYFQNLLFCSNQRLMIQDLFLWKSGEKLDVEEDI